MVEKNKKSASNKDKSCDNCKNQSCAKTNKSMGVKATNIGHCWKDPEA